MHSEVGTRAQQATRRPARPPDDLDQLVHRAEAAETRLRQQTLLVAEAEHKLKTSLAVISGWACTLDDRWEMLSTEQRREGVSAIRRSADSLALQARCLLEDARVEIARLEFVSVPLDLAEIIAVTTRMHHGLSPVHRIEADVVGPVPVCADPGGLQQIIGHLIENAVKYSPDGGVVRLRARSTPDGCWAELAVVDEGVGLPDDVDVFAPFSQGPARHSAGVGLGLYVVRKLVEGMGGTVRGVRNPARGSTFFVLLPAVGR
ncbi:MAG: HAMP domain-containing histidine kinase [Actinobacteria bacterium]|nr:HAMP domain-containing histidine kinase [Actinomycetota bacterium]